MVPIEVAFAERRSSSYSLALFGKFVLKPRGRKASFVLNGKITCLIDITADYANLAVTMDVTNVLGADDDFERFPKM